MTIHPTFALLFCVGFLLFCWFLAIRRGVASLVSRRIIIAAGLLPAILTTLIMWTGRNAFGDLRVSLESFIFDVEEIGDIRVGGSADQDHLVVRGLPDGYLRLQAEGDSLVIRLDPDASGKSPGFGAVRFRGANQGEGPFHNAIPLKAGDMVSLGPSYESLLYSDSPTGFQIVDPENPNISALPIPARTSNFMGLDVPVFKNLSPQIRMFPLRYYGTPQVDGEGGTAYSQLGSFFCWSGTLNRSPHIVLTDPEVQFTSASGENHSYNPIVGRLADGDSAHIDLFRLDYYDPSIGENPRSSRAQERRSFTISFKDGRASLILDTPGYINIDREDWERVKKRNLQSGNSAEPLTLTLAEESFSKSPSENRMFLNFDMVGAPLSHELFSAIQFPDEGSEIKVTTHQGRKGHEFGDGIFVGGKGGLLIRIFRYNFPYGMIAVIWGMSLIAVAGGLDVRRKPIYFVILSGIDFFLAMRVLVAFEAAAMDTAAMDGIWSSLLALCALPAILQIGLALYEDGKPDPLILLHWIGAAIGQIAIFSALPVSLSRAGLVVVACALGPLCLWGLFKGLDKLPASREAFAKLNRKQLLQGLLYGLAALSVFRVGTMLFLGWKERMMLPVGAMAVSIYYTPAVLFLFAILWGARDKLGKWLAPVLFGGMLLILFGVLPLLARDIGTGLIFSVPVLMLFAIPWFCKLRDMKALLYAAPLLLYALFHFTLPTMSLTGLSNKISGWKSGDEAYLSAMASPEQARNLLVRRLDESHNDLRFWSQAAPGKLQEVGTTQAESLSVVMANLKAYGSRGALGEGYLNPPLSTTLSATHLNDNVSSIHILAVYGWLGSFVFLFLTASWALGPLFLLKGGSADTLISPKIAFGLLILWTFLAAAIYMFSANVALVLFTGKNVYFLAASSLSDLVEGGLLAALALWALRSMGVRRMS